VDQEEFLIFGYTTIFDQDIGVRINGTNILSGVPTDTLFDGNLHRLSASYSSDGGAVALYLNGDLIASGTTSSSGLASDGRIVIGQDQDSDGVFRSQKTMKGEVADIRVWDEARTAEQVADNAFVDGFDPASTPSLLANWVPQAGNVITIPDIVAGADLQLAREPEAVSLQAGNDRLEGGSGNDTLLALIR